MKTKRNTSATENQRVTLKMVADSAGLSVAAVSQILNNKSNDFCSETNKNRVREIARKMGYRPNPGVKLMRGEQVKSIAVMLAMDQMELEAHIQRIVLRLFRAYEKKGYSCYFSSDERDLEQNRLRIRNLLDYGVERFIFLGSPLGHEELCMEIHNAGRALVYYETRTLTERQYGVYSDTAAATEKILRSFPIDPDTLAFFQLSIEPDDARFEGLRRALPAYTDDELCRQVVRELPLDIRHGDFTECYRSGAQAIRAALAEKPQLESVFLYSDAFALGAVPVLLEHYRKTGRLVTLAGFNYTFAVQTSVYPIISAEHDCEAIVTALMQDFSPGHPVVTLEPIVRIPKQNYINFVF